VLQSYRIYLLLEVDNFTLGKDETLLKVVEVELNQRSFLLGYHQLRHRHTNLPSSSQQLFVTSGSNLHSHHPSLSLHSSIPPQLFSKSFTYKPARGSGSTLWAPPPLSPLIDMPVVRGLNLALLVYTCIYGLAPSYLPVFCNSASAVSASGLLVATNSTFSVNGPAVWNSLPVDLRLPDISEQLSRNQLKTSLFHATYCLRICCLGEFNAL